MKQPTAKKGHILYEHMLITKYEFIFVLSSNIFIARISHEFDSFICKASGMSYTNANS